MKDDQNLCEHETSIGGADNEEPPTKSPEDELNELCRRHYGIAPSAYAWLKIRQGLWPFSLKDYVEAVRPHVERGKLKNPNGFLVDFAKKFHLCAPTEPPCTCTYGMLQTEPVVFCPNCRLGRDLKRFDELEQRERAPRARF